ncbi:calcium-activated chloride channel regulator 1-like [Chiloscyllium plagiosum]|uniref:calcium-activated chloride channel regulator 1-like n=1 Tax=Chiloscyllium plagiosum TaxID=36176 RepID=UPI001CB7B7E6|nr:calcium-activated chloride channel regulator 1-like [Chiloscyllium plagiosum]
MRFQITFVLVLSYLLCDSILKCTGIKLENNGYRDIIIAINPNVQHNEQLIQNIQEIVTAASSYLHRATKQRVYFADVKILLPVTWPVSSHVVQRLTTESYEKADVIIAEPNPKYRVEPYTLQYGGCGKKGRYIHFTPNFILDSSLVSFYGPKDRAFVHEWAHLRWGVFNEYNELVPFYLFNGNSEVTRCSKEIRGQLADCSGRSCSACETDPKSGLPKRDCEFYPDSKQTASSSILFIQGLSNVTEFCDDKTHNPDAPNMQNKLCNFRSTWDVISESEDFRNNPSPYSGSVIPTFTLLQAKHRALCLVLDVSGSMTLENRINRLRQAAEIFLLQIIEAKSQVGIVTFNSAATIQSHLKVIDNEGVRNQLVQLLPTTANGGTNICAGIQAGFQVLGDDHGPTNGDEVVLLTDGEDSGISSCFSEVEQSGAVIHTIALGPKAAKELEQMSTLTGGRQFAATDNVYATGLTDAFSSMVSGNGDISEQSIQVRYSSVTFSIPAGTWNFAILNPGIEQVISIVMTSRAADEKVPPVTVNVHISEKDSVGGRTIYAEVSQRFSPVLFANVTVIIEQPTGPKIEQELSDDGLGADIVKNDGIYTKYFHKYSEIGRYNFKIRVQGKEGKAKAAIRTGGHSFYIPGYTENGKIKTNPPRPSVNVDDLEADIGDFNRVRSGGSISVAEGTLNVDIPPCKITDLQATLAQNKVVLEWTAPGEDYDEGAGKIQISPPIPSVNVDDLEADIGDFNRVKSGGSISVTEGTLNVDIPPCKITDLQATLAQNKVVLEWTAPGEDYDEGAASRYEMRMSDHLLQLRDNFTAAALVNLTNLNPRPFGSRETFTFVPKNTELQNGTTLYFALCAYDKQEQSSEMSNVAKVYVFVSAPLVEHPKGSSVWKVIWIAIVVAILVCLIIGIVDYLVQKKGKSKAFILV